ncbi:OB-fold domain-containing protein [Desulfotruncus alcoholivorax]|uniref:OB-fold domain-containing protein n=1 Tax=Desulfotruncus alcoholivorax TaxID=265477 RepID=UPI001EE59038|nr:OB-fold domain-containing protein [Desulfotruncus alcoholivorax]
MAYGAYIPFNRLDRKHIKEFYGITVPHGYKAVANYDEDSLTMAIAAALDCASGFDSSTFDGVYFATTTPPHGEKQSATMIAGTLDMKRNARTLDVTGSLRSGSSAMIAAFDAAARGERIMVTVSDTRLGAAGGLHESLSGDGAAAFLLGNDDVIASVLGWHSVAVDFYDNWRFQGDRFINSWEDRFCHTQGYTRFTMEAAHAIMKKTGLNPSDFAKVALYGLKPKDAVAVAVRMGFSPGQVQSNLIEEIGNAGAACAPIALVAALEESRPGDKILFITYGEGSDAIAFEVTESIYKLPPRRGVGSYLTSCKTDMSYGKYLRWRQLLYFEPQRRPPLVRPSLPDRHRNLKKILGFYGTKCKVCSTPQFPPHRVCIQCQSIDQFEDYKFLNKKATLTTYTYDYLAPSPDPPTVMAVVDFEGGGRFVCLMTDYDIKKIRVGMELELSFRRLFEAGGIVTYFWKAMPKR